MGQLNTETILARVLAKFQQTGLEAAAAELASLGISMPDSRPAYSGFSGVKSGKPASTKWL